MANIFRPASNTLVRVGILGTVIALVIIGTLGTMLYRSPLVTMVGVARDQPIPFSHQRHVGGNGLDCRYCHTSVENSSFAGIPATETCMTCHSQILTNAEMLAPVHESWKTGQPLEWARIYDVPDFVYFDHSIHVAKGIGCTVCHGEIQEQSLTAKATTLHMAWCVNCHQAPEQHIRPKERVFDVEWNYSKETNPDTGQPYSRSQWEARALQLVKDYNIHTEQLTDCSICHR